MFFFSSLLLADMQAQLAGAMMKAELEASQRLLSVLPYQTGHVTSRPPAPNRRAMDRHSFALGDTEDYNNRTGRMGNEYLYPHKSFGIDETPMTARGHLQATRGGASPLFPSTSNRPRSVVEGNDHSNLFASNDWSFNSPQQRSSMVGNIGDRANLSRPRSADISTWSFGKNVANDPAEEKKYSSNSPWGRSPTVSTFTGSMIERPNSASDAELAKALHTWTINNGVESHVAFNEDPKANFRRNRNIYRAGIPGTVPETDERSSSSNIVLSMYDGGKPLASSSQSYSPLLSPKALSRPTSRSQSPAPRQSNSTGLVPPSPRSWESRPKSHHLSPGSHHYGQFLNPNDRNDEFDYTSDHSENSNLSGYSQRRRRLSSSASASTRSGKDKRGPETIDMELLQDVPAWLRSLRLHKYNNIFDSMKWQDVVKLSDEELVGKGVAALGARRKMLKVFENVRQHCEENVSHYE
jgi:hypothetical protein